MFPGSEKCVLKFLSAVLSIFLPFSGTSIGRTHFHAIPFSCSICNIADSDNSYIFLTVNNTPQKSNSYVLSETFEIRLYSIRFDFEKITEIYPYDKQSTEYKRFLGKRGEYVDPTNPHIVKIGNQIWDSSSNILDYAKKCYEYVASNYQYLNPTHQR